MHCIYLVPEWMHHIVTERTSVFGAIFVSVETTEYLGSKVGIVEFHFICYIWTIIVLIKIAFSEKQSRVCHTLQVALLVLVIVS